VFEGVANLVAKSLVTADVSGPIVHYRLLDTTRAYALQKLRESGELERLTRRHAEHYRDLFERAEAEWETKSTDARLAAYTPSRSTTCGRRWIGRFRAAAMSKSGLPSRSPRCPCGSSCR
jgi:predicted ATPase